MFSIVLINTCAIPIFFFKVVLIFKLVLSKPVHPAEPKLPFLRVSEEANNVCEKLSALYISRFLASTEPLEMCSQMHIYAIYTVSCENCQVKDI